MINIFVIDDHPMFIDGLKTAFLNDENKIKICGSANSAEEALPLLKRVRVKVVLLDLKMPGISGEDFCLVIKNTFPNTKVIVLTGETDTTLLYNTWNNNADAILIKHCGKQELTTAIFRVLEGKRFLGTNIPEFINQREYNNSKRPRLTSSELKVLSLLAKGRTRTEASIILGNSQNAISFHVKNIYKKFNNNKLVSVVDEAKRLKLIM